MKIVSPYRRIEPFTKHHKALQAAGFDWIDALRMLRTSGHVSAGVETFALTDDELPVPHYRFDSSEPWLMLWILEVSRDYLASPYFDQDTVFISPDCLVCGSLDWFGGFDIGIVNRKKKFVDGTPLLNGLQFWSLSGRVKLIDFYDRALGIAQTLSDNEKRWGADTTALLRLLEPIGEVGDCERSGLIVRVMDHAEMMRTVSTAEVRAINAREKIKPSAVVIDFKYWGKSIMRQYFKNVFA